MFSFGVLWLGLSFGVYVDGGILIGRAGLHSRNGLHGFRLFGSQLKSKIYWRVFSMLLGGTSGGCEIVLFLMLPRLLDQ